MEDAKSIAIPLTQRKWAVIDIGDAPEILAYRWHAQKIGRSWYAARRHGSMCKPGSRIVFMHRQLIPIGEQIDHIDGDGLNNRRSNLRACSCAQNRKNMRRLRTDNTSGFKGVWFRPERKYRPWRAEIMVDKKKMRLGAFATAQEAAMAYDAAARRYFGEFAAPNSDLPPKGNPTRN